MAETITCPACGAEAAANAGFCLKCGKGFRGKYLLAEDEAQRMAERRIASSPTPFATTDVGSVTPGARSSGAKARKAVWSIALVLLILAVLNGVATFGMQTSAPQQAAAAGASCFHVMAIYTLARALEKILS